MKNYLINLGTGSIALGFWLALRGQELGAVALCAAASAALIAAALLRPISHLGTHEARFYLTIGSVGPEGATIQEIKQKMADPFSTIELSDDKVRSFILNAEIEGLVGYREGRLYARRQSVG